MIHYCIKCNKEITTTESYTDNSFGGYIITSFREKELFECNCGYVGKEFKTSMGKSLFED